MLIFDITSSAKAREFLCNFLNITEDNIENYMKDDPAGYDEDYFLEINKVDVGLLEIDNLSLVVNHVTTSDNLTSFKDYGILNLQQSLIRDTNLKRYLNNFEIYIDVESRILKWGKKENDITYRRDVYDGEKKKINEVARKIYNDYQINGFFL